MHEEVLKNLLKTKFKIINSVIINIFLHWSSFD
jgi:hypothetical protein